jgi:hypothetical protein
LLLLPIIQQERRAISLPTGWLMQTVAALNIQQQITIINKRRVWHLLDTMKRREVNEEASR